MQQRVRDRPPDSSPRTAPPEQSQGQRPGALMSRNPQDGWRPPEPPNRPPRPSGPPRSPMSGNPRSRWMPWVVVGVITLAVIVIFSNGLPGSSTTRTKLTFNELQTQVKNDNVKAVTYNRDSGEITGVFVHQVQNNEQFSTTGPPGNFDDATLALLRQHDVTFKYDKSGSNVWGQLLSFALPILLIIGLFVWMSRRAQAGMGAVMNIGRSRAKVYTTEKPKTTFADVAGYGPVKEEIKEVVDFLKQPGKFREIGARIPKGVLLVGPPGTGKTLIARAVAGEAGVPFISVTGSDFMEMFVGVGAARVRDLFQTAKKQSPAIIFIDE